MKRITLLFSFLLFLVEGFSQNSNYKIAIDSLLYHFNSENIFSGNVTIQKGDKVIYNGDFNKFSNGTEKYRVGSVTKVYTALLIYQLIEENKIQLNTTINRYFPEIQNANEITIENLLSHSSGIYNITDWEDYYANRAKHFKRDEIIAVVTSHSPVFKPNSDCIYSNTNYILLGYIIEDITKKTYAQNLKERICDKFNLLNTYFETSDTDRNLREQSYKYNGEVWIKDIDSEPSLPFAAGAVVSTSAEMCKMMYYLFNKQIVSDSSLASMKMLRADDIGHGLFKTPFYHRVGWGHSGRIDEFRSFIGCFPEDSVIIAVTSNGTTVKLNEVLIGVLSKYFGHNYTYTSLPKSMVEIPTTELFIGNYKAKLAGLITVARFKITTAGKNSLFLSENFDNRVKEQILIERKNEYVFYSKEAGYDMTFSANKKGKVSGFKMKQGSFTINCKKVK